MVAIATAKALTKRYPLLEKDYVELGKSWAQKPFPPPWFCSPYENHWQSEDSSRGSKRSRIEVLIVNNVEKHQIPPSLTINFDQAPSKYVQVSSTTMNQKGESNVPVAGISDKRRITATFSITLDNKFLPMQLTYQGKTGQSLPKGKFPGGFSLSVNESHYSNDNEALKS